MQKIFTANCNRDIVSKITYNEFGQTQMFTLGNGVATKYTYDIKGRLNNSNHRGNKIALIKIYQDAEL